MHNSTCMYHTFQISTRGGDLAIGFSSAAISAQEEHKYQVFRSKLVVLGYHHRSTKQHNDETFYDSPLAPCQFRLVRMKVLPVISLDISLSTHVRISLSVTYINRLPIIISPNNANPWVGEAEHSYSYSDVATLYCYTEGSTIQNTRDYKVKRLVFPP